MGYGWLIILSALFALALVLLLAAYSKLVRQKKLIRLQSREIEKQIKELVRQNQLQDELNREKQQLIGVVSHDLKGPFNRIFALIQLMGMDGDNLTDDQRDYLGKIHQITADGLNMVRNLVDARKMDDRGIDLQPEKFNMVALIAPIVKQYTILAEKKKITIVFRAPERLEVVLDKMYFSRVFENLISNALKFSPPEKSIEVSLTDEGQTAMVEVKDHGPGLSETDQALLYQKFQKLTARPTGGESSTGLGLSIAKRILEKMSGEIGCRSKLEEGATFWIRVPKKQSVSSAN
ncbi:MAG: sensor histidine kinase [Bacteroidota bacterium]